MSWNHRRAGRSRGSRANPSHFQGRVALELGDALGEIAVLDQETRPSSRIRLVRERWG